MFRNLYRILLNLYFVRTCTQKDILALFYWENGNLQVNQISLLCQTSTYVTAVYKG